MQSVSYWEAWSLWWAGQKVDGMLMWDVPFLWWGRVGMLMQFGGGLIAILDLIGSERLKSAADETREVSGYVRAYLNPKASRATIPRRYEALTRHLVLIGALFTAVTSWLLLDLLRDWYPESISPLGAVAGIALVLGLGYLLTQHAHLPVRALAWIFKLGRPGHPMRWVAFVFVLVGFHFDLLSS